MAEVQGADGQPMIEDELLGLPIRVPRTMRIEIRVDEHTWSVIDWPLEHGSLSLDDYGVGEVPSFNLAVDPHVVAETLLATLKGAA